MEKIPLFSKVSIKKISALRVTLKQENMEEKLALKMIDWQNVLIKIAQISVIFTHLEMWVAAYTS